MSQTGKPPVVVVGTIFVDLKCFPQYEINFKGRNPGRAKFFHGGVGRNVAETMGLLGSGVRFSASVQEGAVGREVLERLERNGVETRGIHVTSEPDGHGMWVAILHRDGDLACSISQMPNTLHMERAWQNHGKELLDGAKLIVLELDLSAKLAREALTDAHAAGVPVVGLPGNFECIRRSPELLAGLDTFICNQYEAEELYGLPIASVPAARQAALGILERGMRRVVVTMGALGSVAVDAETRDPFHVPSHQVEVVDTTGAGDAFVAGVSHSLAMGADLRTAVQAASRVAAWTVNSAESVCLDIPARRTRDPWEGWGRL